MNDSLNLAQAGPLGEGGRANDDAAAAVRLSSLIGPSVAREAADALVAPVAGAEVGQADS